MPTPAEDDLNQQFVDVHAVDQRRHPVRTVLHHTLKPLHHHDRLQRIHSAIFLASIPLVLIGCFIVLGVYLKGNMDAVIAGRSVAGICGGMATILTFFLIYCHLHSYTHPSRQRYIGRILILVIVYSVDSFLALVLHKEAIWIDLIRDAYEAYVIFTFFALLLDYLGGTEGACAGWKAEYDARVADGTVEDDERAAGGPMMAHPIPMCWLPKFRLSETTLWVWRVCALQYTVLNPLLAILAIILYACDKYVEGEVRADNGYVYIAGIRFVSVTFAFTSLFYLYLATKKQLAPHKPLLKFVAIKAIIFVSFWQTVFLSGLSYFAVIKPSKMWTKEEVTTGLGNFVLCIEMYLAAVAHHWIFSDEPYRADTAAVEATPVLAVSAAEQAALYGTVSDGAATLVLDGTSNSASSPSGRRLGHAVKHLLSVSDVVDEVRQVRRRPGNNNSSTSVNGVGIVVTTEAYTPAVASPV